jgi:putative NADH-flavin reductase
MHITLYGATGNAGSRILTEALNRGHQVTAIVRDPAKLTPRPGLTVIAGDHSTVSAIVTQIQGSDAVVSALGPGPDNPAQLVSLIDPLIAAVQQNGSPRLLVVGGAGSLNVAPGVSLIDSGYLPAEWLGIAKAHAEVLDHLRASDIDWTSFCPASFFEPGERTGKFRLGADDLVSDANHQSRISMEDYAIALVDELEKPQHIRARFTIGY